MKGRILTVTDFINIFPFRRSRDRFSWCTFASVSRILTTAVSVLTEHLNILSTTFRFSITIYAVSAFSKCVQ